MNLRFLLEAIRCWRAGRMGDSAGYKAAAFGGRAYPAIEAALRRLDEPFPAIDLDRLRGCPPGSFGQAYVAFMDANRLRPFLLSPEAATELGRDHVLEVRYPLLHDAFHTLLGFDTSLPGELGVWSFVAAQRYSPQFDRAGRLGALLYPIVAPGRRAALRAAAERGRRLARRAPCLIAEKLERSWAEPLPLLRARLGLVDSNGAGR